MSNSTLKWYINQIDTINENLDNNIDLSKVEPILLKHLQKVSKNLKSSVNGMYFKSKSIKNIVS